MWIDFDKLPENARVWVYQSNRSLTDTEVTVIEQGLQPALHQWTAHGQPLLASALVIENRFVVIAVDEGYTLPSGCSIDASVRILREMGQQTDVDFFDRSAVALMADGSVQTFALPTIKDAVTNGLLTSETTVFNTLVTTKAEFSTNWRVRAINSWLKRYFKPITA